MGNSKRGQLTIFIIVAIIIVVILLVFLSLSSNINPISLFNKPESLGIPERVEGCIENSTLDSVYFLGLQGGYFYNIPDDAENYGDLYIPVYLDEGGKMNLPSKTVLESELNLAIKEILKLCVGEFGEEESQGYVITVGEVKSVNLKIGQDFIDVNVDFPITMTKGTNSKVLESYNKRVNFKFAEKYDLVYEFVVEQKKDMKNIPVSYIAELAKENNFTVESIDAGNNTELYTFVFPEKHIGINYMYNFFVRYPDE